MKEYNCAKNTLAAGVSRYIRQCIAGVLLILLQCAGLQAVAAEGVSQAYTLSPQDELDIYVWKEDDLKRTVVVLPDGAISFPLVGVVTAAGKTVLELQEEITEGLRKYIPGAVVTVSIAKVHGYQVYVVGKVVNPGQYTLGNYINVIQAITIADGVTPYADKSAIKIIRKTANGDQIFKFNYDHILKGKNLDQNIQLLSGDTVLVP